MLNAFEQTGHKKKKKNKVQGKKCEKRGLQENKTLKYSLTLGVLQQPTVSETDKGRMIKWQGSLWSNRDKKGGYTVFRTLFLTSSTLVRK